MISVVLSLFVPELIFSLICGVHKTLWVIDRTVENNSSMFPFGKKLMEMNFHLRHEFSTNLNFNILCRSYANLLICTKRIGLFFGLLAAISEMWFSNMLCVFQNVYSLHY